MRVPFTIAEILAQAPDDRSVAAAQKLVSGGMWDVLGFSARAVWGECAGSGKKPYLVRVDHSGPAYKCSCPSRKFPCKHSLALLLLAVSQPAIFNDWGDQSPRSVAEWLADRDQRVKGEAERAESEVKGPDSKAQARRAASREKKVRAGLAELRIWLEDAVREGLAAFDAKPYSYFDECGARMTDAQAPGLARMVRSLAGTAGTDVARRERLLLSVSRIHLLVAAMERQDDLSDSLRAEVRSRIGWAESQDDLLMADGVTDEWLVVGRRHSERDRLRTRRTWAIGKASRRPVLVLDFAAGNTAFEATLTPGTIGPAELVFYPGPAPLRALVKKLKGAPRPLDEFPGQSVPECLAAFSAAVAETPWLMRFPFCLSDVTPVSEPDRWLAVDREGRALPLDVRAGVGWRLLALSGGSPVGLFGEWDGFSLRPLTLFTDGRLVGVDTAGVV